MSLEPTIMTRDRFTVVGMRITTTAMAAAIPELWARFAPRIDEVPSIAEPHVSYGLMENVDAAQGRFDYMAAVPVTGQPQLPEGMTALTIEGATYAVFAATLATIGSAFAHIFGVWLPAGDYEQIDAPYFERYDASFNPADPSSRIEIHIPIKKRTA